MRQPNIRIFHSSSRRGFTLIELLVALGIIVALTALAIPAILHARKKGIEIRVKSDLALINTAIEAYRGDFRGDYPRFATAADDYAAAQSNAPTTAAYPWLDYRKYRGAVLLCRALIGPGPGPQSASAAQPIEVQGEDGADGPGSRANRLLSQIGGVWVATGKVYGPYLDAAKFKLIKFQTSDPDGCQMIADSSGNPILYYPAALATATLSTANNTSVVFYSVDGARFYFDPSTYNPTDANTNNITPARFNGYDNEAFLDSISGGTTYSNTSSFDTLAKGAGSLPYLLWTAGIDGKFGVLQGKTDDIANFDLPLAK